MPKSQFIDPNFLLQKSKIIFEDIAVNSYCRSFNDEKNNFTKAEFCAMAESLATIRESETIIKNIKNNSGYHGYKHDYNGPAHLAIGQEASSVGQAFTLDKEDIIFGSHRAHAELIARGLRTIETLPQDELIKIMENFDGGANYDTVLKYNHSADYKDIAKDFLLFGTLSEIFAKATGFQKGMSGSMHAFFQPFGVYPNNAIVGASAPIATGAALYKKIMQQQGIVVANIGDGALGCGVVYESMNFAAMDQFRMLWKTRGALPIIFAISDNGYGMGGQTRGETMAYDFLARLGAGITANQMHAERIDGTNVLAVIDAYRRKKALIASGESPILLDIVNYRYEGHSLSDKMSYREEQEIEAWRLKDPVVNFPQSLVDNGIITANERENIALSVLERTKRIAMLVTNDKIAPYFDFVKNPKYLQGITFSNKVIEKMASGTPIVLAPKEDSPRVIELAKKSRCGLDTNGNRINNAINVQDALFEAIIDKFYCDPTLIAYGEEVRDWGGICGVYRGLTEVLPYNRLFNSPISEATLVSSAVGYAMCGGRVIIEIMFADFMARAADEIFNQLAKWQAMSAGAFCMPVVIRVAIGAKYGTQHSQDWTALVAHIPGLKVVYPATPYDCKGLMATALSQSDPVVFFESQKLYEKSEIFRKEGVPQNDYKIPLGVPDIKVVGTDITIVTLGACLYPACEAVDKLAKNGVMAELIDMRSVVPFCYDEVVKSVKKTGRLLLVTDAAERCSVMQEVSQKVTEMAFSYLKKPPHICGGLDTIIPPYEYSDIYYPTVEKIVAAVNNMME